MAAKRKTSPAVTRTEGHVYTDMTITVPGVESLASDQSEAEANLAVYQAMPALDGEADLALADALLTEVVTKKDAVEAMLERAVGPLKASVREVSSWFGPLRHALKEAEDTLKALIGDYRRTKLELEQAARAEAQAAAQAGDGRRMIEAVTIAAEVSARDDARATTRFVWTYERIAADLLQAEWWCPDEPRLAKHLACLDAGPDAETPVIPGVVGIKRKAIVGARR